MTAYRRIFESARRDNVEITGAIATAFGCPFEGAVDPDQVLRLAAQFVEAGVAEVDFADTVGMAVPPQIDQMPGRAIKAYRACEWGLANRAAPAGQALAVALEIADEIVASAPMAVRAAKVAINRGMDSDSRTAYALDIAAYNVLIGSEDRLEGIAAFNEKRKPAWKNR